LCFFVFAEICINIVVQGIQNRKRYLFLAIAYRYVQNLLGQLLDPKRTLPETKDRKLPATREGMWHPQGEGTNAPMTTDARTLPTLLKEK